jgi:putative tryptophan/tyrosine transport system substrate-binding protein
MTTILNPHLPPSFKLHAGALVVGSDAFFNSRRQQLVSACGAPRCSCDLRMAEFAAEGGLISYGPNQISVGRQLGIYAGKIP